VQLHEAEQAFQHAAAKRIFIPKEEVMKRSLQIVVLVLAVAGLVVTANASEKWTMNGKAITADNCAVGCPCIFGEPPTHETCRFVGIMQVEEGKHGEVALDGVRFGLAGEFAGEGHHDTQGFMYVAYYIDSNASEAQREAVKAILEGQMFKGLGKPVEVKEVPITITGLENFGMVDKAYGGSIGDLAKIQVAPISGFTQGKPLVVENSAEPLFNWTALGKAKASFYKSGGQDFKFDGTSGESHKFSLAGGGE
jgi:hypothetical protein